MEFLLLGPLEARHDGQPLLLGPRRAQRCLLGLLLLEIGRMVPVDRLADLLWDDTPPDNAQGDPANARLSPEIGARSAPRRQEWGQADRAEDRL